MYRLFRWEHYKLSQETGLIHYNEGTQQFEGYSSGSWQGLGGVTDVDQDTYISAEDAPNTNNNELKFYTVSNERMIIDASGNVGIGTTSALDSTYKLEVSGNVKATKFVEVLESTNVDINGGAIDGVTIGTNSACTDLRVDNIQIDGNTITSTNTNGNINITPNGSGEVNISKVDIDTGAIDGTTIGAATPSTGNFTTLSANNFSSLDNEKFSIFGAQSNIRANNFIFTNAIVNNQQVGTTPSAI